MSADPHVGSIVSVVILSYNRPMYLRDSIKSILRQTYRPLEIILVDNMSQSSEEIRQIAKAHPEVVLMGNEQNLGFSGGMNKGIARASGEYVLLTEDDVMLADDCIAQFVRYFQSNARAGVASGVMLNRNAGTIRSAGGFIELDGRYALRLVEGDVGGEDRFSTPFEVGYIPGAMVFCRAVLFEDVGGFREDFFMYVEDVEFCQRVSKAGYPIAIVPTARSLHVEPGDTAESDEITFHKRKNLGALYLLHARPRVWPEFALRYFVIPIVKSIRTGSRDGLSYTRSALWLARSAPRLLVTRMRWLSQYRICRR